MPAIRLKIKIVIVLMLAAIGVSWMIEGGGGFSITGKNEVENIVKEDTLYSKGEALFQANCKVCHRWDSDVPRLTDIEKRMPSPDFVEQLLLNTEETLQHNPYALKLIEAYNLSHPSFAGILTREDIKATVYYITNHERHSQSHSISN